MPPAPGHRGRRRRRASVPPARRPAIGPFVVRCATRRDNASASGHKGAVVPACRCLRAPARRQGRDPTGASPIRPNAGGKSADPLAYRTLRVPTRRQGRRLIGVPPLARGDASPRAPPYRRVAQCADQRRLGCRPIGVPPPFARRRVARGTSPPARRPPHCRPAMRAPPHSHAASLYRPPRRQGHRPTGASPTALTAGDQGAAPLA